MANIFLSIPVLDKPELAMIYSVYKAILSTKHNIRIHFVEKDSLISRARNVAISAFYDDCPEADFFMSLDSDLEIVNCYPSNNIFDKLVAHDIDFVGGLYAVKQQGQPRCASITIDGVTPQFDSGLIETPWLSSGCWCLKRSVVKKMIKEYPELEYDGDDIAVGKKVYGLYIPMLHDMTKDDFPEAHKDLPYRKYLSEDWSFTQRWKEIGGKIYADSSIVLKHIGKIAYSLYNVEVVPVNSPNISSETNPPDPGFDLNKGNKS